ncbi:MAG: SufD family Fe-S cluster assembly protein, partial [Dehalococcoidales bacterium]|nr:SufD family Fe-S cluster assembly protein [Dehalococcoidales bacterium]
MTDKDIKEKAKAALDKKPAYGEDIDLKEFRTAEKEHPYLADPSALPATAKEQMLGAGIVLDDISQRIGTYLQIDNTPVHHSAKQEGIEVMPLSQALGKYDWLGDYLWKAVPADSDKFTANVALHEGDGYFIRALPGRKTLFPVQACLYLAQARSIQDVHNIIIAEEGSELHIITGCAAGSRNEPGLHIGVSEFYVKRGAKISFTMIHSWNPQIAVRPRSATIIEDGGIFLNNYVLMKPVNSLQMYPTAICRGENAIVRFNSVIAAAKGTNIDSGSRVFLNGRNARAEIISRAITTGGTIVARG